MSRLEELQARQVLQHAGIAYDGELTRAASVTNEVWLADHHVVRLGRDLSGRLAREAQLISALPPEVGCPPIVHAGKTGQITYLVAERLAGVPLSSVWSRLNAAERAASVISLGARLAALHATPAPTDLPLADPPQPIGGPDPIAPVLATIEAAQAVDGSDFLLLSEVRELVESLRPALPTFDTSKLVHGDLSFGNVLWDRGDVTALLDFEFARGAPSDLDLDIILRMCAYPALFVVEERVDEARPSDYLGVRRQLELSHPEMFAAARLNDRLRLFAIAFTARELAVGGPIRPRAEQGPGHPERRLEALLRRTSYLD